VKFSSFRDPVGRVFFDGDEVIRVVAASAREQVEEFLDLAAVAEWQTTGRLIAADPVESTRQLNGLGEFVSEGDLVFSHPRVWFPSYPHEWPSEMLEAAGRLTLEMAETLLQKGWGLKDATPFNVLFQGTKPVFIDLLSFEKRSPSDPIWLPYQQFVNTFLLPLLVNKRCGVPLRTTFLADREGLDVNEASGYLSGAWRFDRTALGLVTLPKMLSAKAERSTELYSKKRQMEPDRAKYVLQQMFRRLRKNLDRVSPDPQRSSKWTGYTKHNVSTIPAYMSAKRKFVEDTVRRIAPRSVLDIGCNTGHFSFFAARLGAKVVAIDHDPAVVGQVWRDADSEGLDVLPLVVDISRPSPRSGWRNSEVPSFLDRAEGRFDLVMMLAVLHHILVQDRIPLRDVLKLAADLTTNALIIEFVPPSDPLFRKIARGRDYLHTGLIKSAFESAANEFFDIVAFGPLPDTDRILYFLKIKANYR
jgi:2-polyprenyl-3-methyl-5-hydroxy-6-metoxy-1,4-benzoquinol methylase